VTKKLATLCVLTFIACFQRPSAQAGTGRIFFVDVGQGAGTLIVSPTGQTLLMDGGPPGAGAKIGTLLDTLGIPTIDYTVLSHYHIDHDSGLTELLNTGRVAGIAFDNGDGPLVAPPNSGSTRTAYLNYVAATGHPGVTRQTILPGQVIDLGGGMRVTCLAAGGQLLSGGSVTISNEDLNTSSISLLVEFNNFDFIVSGDLTGGGSTSTLKTPDVETFVGQLAGDVDVIQLNHHGSTTTSNQVYLSTVKAEVAVAEIGTTNTFGHPNRETVNKYLNTPVTSGLAFGGTGVPAPGAGPVFYQPEESPTVDDRVSHQGHSGASAAAAGNGTILLETDGVTTYSLKSFDDLGARLNPSVHVYAVDGVSAGVTTDFPPTVVVETTPVAPLAVGSVVVSAAVNDRESPIGGVVLDYAVDGVLQTPLPMTLSAGFYEATIPAQVDGARVDFRVSGTTGGQTTSFTTGYFSGTTPVASLRAIDALGVPMFNGYAARIHGTVTAGSNTFGSGTNDDYVQDASGGINVFRSNETATPFSATAPGHVVDVVGRIAFNGGRARLDITESLEKLTSPYGVIVTSPGAAPIPAGVTIADLSLNRESYEGQFVSIPNVQIVSGSLPITPQSQDTFVTIDDGTGTFSLKVDHNTDIEGFNPGTTFTVAGIIQQDDFLRPFSSGYNIAPRGRPDLGGAAAGTTLVSIADARIDAIVNADASPGADFIPDLLNQLVKVRGAVTSIDFRGGNGIEYYVQDATGGIVLFSGSQNFGPFSVGDSVEAVGLVAHFNGLTEISASSVTALPPGTVAAASPQIVTVAQLANGGVGEALEGRLIRIEDVTITSGAFPAANADANLTITDATGSAVMRIDRDTNIDGTPTPSGTFSVVGVLGQFDSSNPFDSGYQLFPRTLADIVVSGAAAITAAPSSYDFGSVPVGGTAFKTFTITNTGGSSVTLTTPLTLTGANANQFSVGLPVTTTLEPGASTTVAVTFLPTTTVPESKSATLNISSTGGTAVVSLTGTAQIGGGGPVSTILISEFRFRGTNGANDEFVELYNNSDAAISIGGYILKRSNGSGAINTQATILAGTTIPARGHYLIGNAAAGAPNSALFNQTYPVGITDDGGAAIFLPDNTTIVDQVGTGAGSAFREGTQLTTLTTNTNQSYERKLGGVNGSQQDTNSNSTDFQLRAPSDPQNLISAPTPGISVSPSSINFGSIVAGGTVSTNVTITNLSATANVDLGSLVLGGTNPGSFAVGAPGTTLLGPSSSTTATVTFQPGSSGAHSATLTVPTVSNGSVNISLAGTATGGIDVNPASVDFGTQEIGSLSGATLTVSASSPVTLTPPFTVSGTNAAEFFVGAPSTTTISPGNDATVAVGFQPTTVGPKSASLLITSLDGGSQTIALSGQVECPAVTIAGSLPGGFVATPYSQTLTASGGTDPYNFTVFSGALPTGLSLSSAGTVSGSPLVAGPFSATIRATDANGCFGEATYAIGILAATLAATPSPLAFGVTLVGSPQTLSVTITNTSSFAVTLLPPFAITGTGAALYSAGVPVSPTLGPGVSTTVPVTFSPAVAGGATATLTITSSAGGSTTGSLTGTGRLVSTASALVISEFRFRGPAGASDEFVELYNNSDSSVDIGGLLLRGSNNTGGVSTRATVGPGTEIPARGHYLFVNEDAPAAMTNLADQTYATGFTADGGVAIAESLSTILDQVALSAGSAFGEGAHLSGFTNDEDRSYERKLGGANGSGVDTGDNAGDFQLITPSAPQNLASAITPALSVSPASIDFGSVARGSTAGATVTIANNAAVAVTLASPFTLSGTHATEFSVGLPASTTINARDQTTALVTFQPNTLGPKAATLSVSSTSSETHLIALTGIASCPAITVSAALSPFEAGVFASQTVSASGGSGTYSFVIASGALPGGLSLSSSGILSGTPTATGSFPVTIRATEEGVAPADACSGSTEVTVIVRRTLTAVGPAKVWIGLKNSDAVGLRLDVRTQVLVNGEVAASGDLNNVSAGGSGFNNAILQSVAMSLSAPVEVPAGGLLSVQVSVRRTCFGGGHNSGIAREWYNGQPVDGGAGRDAGSRIRLTVGGVMSDYFLRHAFGLATAAGTAKQSADAAVNSSAACPARPFVPFGTWGVNLQ
jgi:beta-lactamase superfamily II metal-dependent hydrolase/DNA/RNA endonuclease YhcR with UshA esterase domain